MAADRAGDANLRRGATPSTNRTAMTQKCLSKPRDFWISVWRWIVEDTDDEDADSGAVSFRFEFISSAGNVFRVKKMDINFKGAGTETIRATGFVDANGNPTAQHGAITYASSDTSIATVGVQPDGVTAIITATGAVGVATITATDAQDNISQTATVTTTAGEAVAFTLEQVAA